ncbi:MAG: hypothetical protein ACK5QC_09050 [Bacteroidota bacterium]
MGQKDSVKRTFQAVYIEVLGIGGYGSINYERAIFNESKKMITIRGGISAYQLKDYRLKFNPDLQFPLTINGNYGDKHKIEAGLGQVISTMVEARPSDNLPKRLLNFHSVLLVGYFYQKTVKVSFFDFIIPLFLNITDILGIGQVSLLVILFKMIK